MKHNMLLLIGLATTLGGLVGCNKDPLKDMTEDESRLYITNHDSTVNFSVYKTFYIVDSAAVVDGGRLQEKVRTNVDAAYIDAVRTNMQSRGFTLVAKNQSPDLGISVSRIYNTYTGVISYPDYWGGYYGYWDPYYWGYPGYNYYFPSYGVYQVTEGAVSIDILDLKDAGSNNNQIKGVWNGLVRGSGTFRTENVAGSVNALFQQSAYLRTNQ